MSFDFLTLTAYGDQIELKPTIDGKKFVSWTEDNFNYVRYNPRHDVNRWGLSITSLDGGLSGVPDLDSLHQYNIENNTSHAETDFDVVTPVYEQYNELQHKTSRYTQIAVASQTFTRCAKGCAPDLRRKRRQRCCGMDESAKRAFAN